MEKMTFRDFTLSQQTKQEEKNQNERKKGGKKRSKKVEVCVNNNPYTGVVMARDIATPSFWGLPDCQLRRLHHVMCRMLQPLEWYVSKPKKSVSTTSIIRDLHWPTFAASLLLA